MKRRTLDVMFSAGGLGLAALLLIMGLVMTNRADFSKRYVHDEMVQQDIAFPAADKLAPKERAFTEARSGCVLKNAGQQVLTGKQGECYANEYLGGHLTWLATRLGMTQVAYLDGMNYTKLGAEQSAVKTRIAAAQAANDSALPALQQQLADVTTVRTKMFEGTMLRNALLTSYGFSVFGVTAATVAKVSYVVAAILLLLSLAGFTHALLTPTTETFAAPVPAGATQPATPSPDEPTGRKGPRRHRPATA